MRATRYDRYRRAQNADHFAHNSPFSAFFAEVVCTLGMTPPRTAISPPPKGVCTTSMESTARPAGPGCGTRGLRCPWAAARPGRASRRRTQPHTATQAPPVWRVPEGTEGTGALRDDAPSHAQRHKRRRYGGCRQDQRVAVPGCGARGRRQGLAGLRDDAPSHTQRHKRRRCGGCRRARRARAGFEIDHSEPQARVWRSRGRPGPTAPGTPAAPRTPSTSRSTRTRPHAIQA